MAFFEIADAVRRDIRDLKAENILSCLQMRADLCHERQAPQMSDGRSVQRDACGFANVAEVEQPIVILRGCGHSEFNFVSCSSGEAFGFAAFGRPRTEIR